MFKRNTEASNSSLMLPVLARSELETLAGLQWGQFGELPDAATSPWLEHIPANGQREVLATGPAFEQLGNTEKLISSESLFAPLDEQPEEGTVVSPEEGWYVLIADPAQENAVVLAAPFDDHLSWIDELRRHHRGVEAYAIKKNPEQGEDGQRP